MHRARMWYSKALEFSSTKRCLHLRGPRSIERTEDSSIKNRRFYPNLKPRSNLKALRRFTLIAQRGIVGFARAASVLT